MISMRARGALVTASAAVALCAPAATAQSNLSTQGLGFPPGQLSTQALTMGGSFGEVDPMSPLNPAAIGTITAAILMLQAQPEYRTVRTPGTSQRTSVSRFPLFVGVLPMGTRWAIAASASTLLDRTWETMTRDSQVVGTETVPFTRTQSSDGSISDLRVAVAYAPTTWLKVGLAGHALSGRDLLLSDVQFDDTAHFARDLQQTTLSFAGNAVSLGVMAAKARIGAVGLSYRQGARMSVLELDNTVGRGFVPNRFGASLTYLGIAGTTFAASASKDSWKRLQGLSPSLSINEGWDIGVGADVTGPTYGGGPMSFRVGGRWRTLPFSADSAAVKERTWSTGFGVPMARGDVQFNFGVLRASRRGPAGISESAWTLSTGFAIRP